MYDHTPAVSFWREMGIKGEPGSWDEEDCRTVAAQVQIAKKKLIFFSNVWQARSRLYQNEILQENNTKTYV